MPQNHAWLTHAGAKPPDDLKLEPEYQPHYAAWKATPTPVSAGNLLRAVNPVVEKGLKAYGGVHANAMTKSRARSLALDAFRTYDPTKSTLKNHVLGHMQGLQRYAARQNRMLSVPEQVVIDRQRIDAAENELRDRHGRDPSTLELSDHAMMSPKRIAYVRKYNAGFSGSEAASRASEVGAAGDDPAVDQGDPTAARLEFLYHDLDPINQVIAEHAAGLHGRPKLRNAEIARRVNLSPGAVSQRMTRIQEMLDSLDDAGVL